MINQQPQYNVEFLYLFFSDVEKSKINKYRNFLRAAIKRADSLNKYRKEVKASLNRVDIYS